MLDPWLNAMDNGKMVGVVLVDFKKAFDLVDQQMLLSKLELYSINNEVLCGLAPTLHTDGNRSLLMITNLTLKRSPAAFHKVPF